MPRKPRIPRKSRALLTEQMCHFLEFGEFQKGPDNVLVFNLAGRHPGDEEQLRKIWDDHKEEILRSWKRDCPCSRPWAWWHLEAPEPRRKVGGTGIPAHEKFSRRSLRCEYGIPVDWYAMDHEDPPRFEAQASYLERLGLLSPAEKRFLSVNPELMEPISLGDE